MKIFGKIMRVWQSSQGTRQDGTAWSMTSVLVEEIGGGFPQSVCAVTYGTPEELMEHTTVSPGRVGTMTFTMTVRTWNDKVFNDVKFRMFESYKSDEAIASAAQAVASAKSALDSMSANPADSSHPSGVSTPQADAKPSAPGVDDLPF